MKALALLAVILGALLAGVVYLGLDRLGHLETWAAPEWKFENQLLRVPLGTRVVIVASNPKAMRARFMFERKVTEPTVIRDRPIKPSDPPPRPYVLLFVETRKPEEQNWMFTTVAYATLAQMGARSSQEWLEEIQPVRERLPDGSEKIMLRVRYGHENGGQVAYFYDPKDPDPAARGFGWTRVETYGGDAPTMVEHSYPGGRYTR